jgi:hypothetical protein
MIKNDAVLNEEIDPKLVSLCIRYIEMIHVNDRR